MDMSVQFDDTGQVAMVTGGARRNKFPAAQVFGRADATSPWSDSAQPRIQTSKQGRHL